MQENKFKIGYFADGPWSHNAFKILVKDSRIKISFIVPRKDTSDQTLKKFSTDYNIDYLNPEDINSDEFYEKVKKYNCDIFVSLSFNQIFRKRIFNLPRLKTINCHAGKLPFYRGRNVLNWCLINDEKEFGITVHMIDEGIDTGDIILQRVYKISEKDDYKSILNKAHVECGIILYDAIKKIINNDYTLIKQDSIDPIGFYCGGRGEGDELIDWNQNSRQVFNFIRSICHPGPKATTFFKGHEVKINKVEFIPNIKTYLNKPGQILNKFNGGYIIKTKDTFIKIFEVETEINLKVGDILQ